MENMTDLIISGLIIAAEVAFGLSVLLVIIVLTSVIRRRYKNQLAGNLIDDLQVNGENRMKQLRDELNRTFSCDKQLIEKRVDVLYDKEKKLYEHILAIYQKGSPGLLEGVSQDIEALLKASRELFISDKSNDKKAIISMIKKQSVLKEENHRLKESLAAVKLELHQVKTEFSAMYNKNL